MIVVYDHDDNQWVKAQLREVQRILARHRDKASSPKAVFEGPGDKPPVGMRLRNMTVVKCHDGFDAEKLRPFLDEVEERARQRLEAIQGPVLVEHRDHYDVFLAHNSVDKDFVRGIHGRLVDHDIYPWLDENEILPGQWFQDVIQESMKNVSSAAIFVGKSGLGRWQPNEFRTFYEMAIQHNLPLIPVLLPGVSEIPDDLIFLRNLHQVRFGSLDDNKALQLLVSGIKGQQLQTT